MSDERKFRMHDGKTGAAITVRITPKSSRNEIVEVLNDGTVKIRLMAVAAGGATNQLLTEFLAGILGVKQTQIEVVAGDNGKDKLITIANVTPTEVQEKIIAHLA